MFICVSMVTWWACAGVQGSARDTHEPQVVAPAARWTPARGRGDGRGMRTTCDDGRCHGEAEAPVRDATALAPWPKTAQRAGHAPDRALLRTSRLFYDV